MGKDVWHDPAFKVYRGLGILYCAPLLGSRCARVRRAGIDYERFLRIPPAPPGSDQVWSVKYSPFDVMRTRASNPLAHVLANTGYLERGA